jgi:hypothetical protein
VNGIPLAALKRYLIILATIAVLVTFAVFGSWGGQRIVGFRYGVLVNNLATECPNTVVSVDGSRVTLDDGRVVVVKGPQAQWLDAELKECENRVRYDASEKTLYTMRRVAFCGFDRPQRCQLITIPLKRVDLRQYTSRQFAEAREARPTGGG